jgi:hypothetical protein
MGGSIRVKSRSGVGTRFTMTIPMHRVFNSALKQTVASLPTQASGMPTGPQPSPAPLPTKPDFGAMTVSLDHANRRSEYAANAALARSPISSHPPINRRIRARSHSAVSYSSHSGGANGDDSPRSQCKTQAISSSPSLAAALPPKPTRKPQVLIVEDQIINQKVATYLSYLSFSFLLTVGHFRSSQKCLPTGSKLTSRRTDWSAYESLKLDALMTSF